jgi:hypothetical protein
MNEGRCEASGGLRDGQEARAARVFLLSLVCLAAPLTASVSQAQVHDEYAVKAAFVYNLTKYVEWPQARNQLVVAVMGEGPMPDMLKQMLDKKTSESRSIHVVLSPSEEELQHCDILYIANSSSKQLRATLDEIHRKEILTVGDAQSFARDGGMVGLVRVGEQVQLQINLEATQQSHLKISSRLLNIALLVQPGGND